VRDGDAAIDRLEAALVRATAAAERLAGPDPAVRALIDAVADAVRELDALIGPAGARHG
jgi:ABC-type transporter Mla subunit MlaD